MKELNDMKKFKTNTYRSLLVIAMMVIVLPACNIDEIDDPNNPPITLVNDATLGEMQNLISGMESGMRNRLGTYYDAVGVVGREFYRFSNSDPRFTTDLLGGGSSSLDNNTFYTTGPFNERYRVVKNANLLLEAIDNTSAALTTAELNAMRGYAKTIKAYQLLLVLNQQYSNGIRVDVDDPDNLGPRLDLSGSLSAIAALLDEGYGNITTPTMASAFPFAMSSGFANFDNPAAFAQFNRALAARVALYSGSNPIPFLNDSFFDLTGNLNDGPSHSFSTAGGDLTNPVFFPPNATGEVRLAHPDFITDAEAGDTRLSKVLLRTSGAAVLDGLSSDYDFYVFTGQGEPIPIIRNEELILIYAEANVGTNNTEAVNAINVIRNAAGLADYAGPVTDADILNEIINQRRYSLFGEGHRWVDMRRLNRLSDLPLDRAEDDIWTEFPVPATEG